MTDIRFRYNCTNIFHSLPDPNPSNTMQTLKITAHVNEDGILQIQLPDHPGETLEILLVYQPVPTPPKRQWSQQVLSTFGAWQGAPIERAPQEDQPERDVLL